MHAQSQKSAAIVRERIGAAEVDVGLVLSSGLAGIADHVASPTAIPYEELPGFVRPRVGDTPAELVIGTLGTARIAILKGRSNYHETGDAAAMRVPLETLKLLGAGAVVLTAAVGSTRREFRPGTFVTIRDHINLTGINPLVGTDGLDRSVDLVAAYDPHLRDRFALAAAEGGRKIAEGTLMWFPGPSFETPAEVQAARLLGADFVGMSLVPEAIIARQLGLRVLAPAMVTNHAAGVGNEVLSREEILRVSQAAIVTFTRVLLKFFDLWVIENPRRSLDRDHFSGLRNPSFPTAARKPARVASD